MAIVSGSVLVRALTMVLSVVSSCSVSAAMGVPKVSAQSAVLMDAETGRVLWSLNPDAKRQPASTTKVMTAIVALESSALKTVVTVSKEASSVEGSSMYLKPGEKLTIKGLLYGAMLSSGNDACIALAEATAGSVPAFVSMMNDQAKAIGARATAFTNPNGLPDPGHYTTARDLALMTRFGMGMPLFRDIVATKETIVSSTDQGADRHLTNHNKLLWRYEGADGVKTGYTRVAGKCLVASATREGQQLIAVILGSGNIWADSVSMLDYGFGSFSLVKGPRAGEVVRTVAEVRGGDGTPLLIAPDKDLTAVADGKTPVGLKRVITLRAVGSAPINKGARLGTVELKGPDGRVYSSAHLVAANTVLAKPPAHRLWTALLSVIRIIS